MTTREQQTETTSTPEVASTEGTDPSTAPTKSSADQAEPLTTTTESSTAPTKSSTTVADTSAAGAETPTEETLFAEDELSRLRSRWDDVQSAFVDDPRECVQKADALVSDVVERLTTGFTEARSRLEARWAQGEEASTEDLRLAVRRYREFFQRLLAV